MQGEEQQKENRGGNYDINHELRTYHITTIPKKVSRRSK